MDEERRVFLKELERRLGYEFRDPRWLDKALTHKSYPHQTGNGPKDPSDRVANEVLEFLGDAVLNLAVSRLLFDRLPDADEGTLSQHRAHLVKRASLASLARELRLERYLLLGKGEMLDGGRKKSSILANAYEALIGAIYLDSSFEVTYHLIENQLAPHLRLDLPPRDLSDSKSLLQEYTQRAQRGSPKYRVLQESGPDHDKRFQASVIVNGIVLGMGWGKSKKEAEQEAARKALQELDTKAEGPDHR